jgi:nitrite reductase (NADH) small subunit
VSHDLSNTKRMPQRTMSQFFNVCKKSEIPIGEGRMFIVNEMQIGIFNVAGELFALDDHCPHAGASLSHGIVDGDVVRCRIHHWRFCIRNGVYLNEAKPRLNVETYPVRIVDEQVQVEI